MEVVWGRAAHDLDGGSPLSMDMAETQDPDSVLSDLAATPHNQVNGFLEWVIRLQWHLRNVRTH